MGPLFFFLLLQVSGLLVTVNAFVLREPPLLFRKHCSCPLRPDSVPDNDDAKDYINDMLQTLQVSTIGAASKVKKGGSEVVAAAGVTAAHLASLAETSGSGVKSAFAATSVRLSEMAESSGIVSAANVATKSFVGFLEKGSAEVASVANVTTNSATEIVRWIDGQAKEGASTANSKSKALVLGFTGKDTYEFGDLSKELLRRIAATEIDLNDVALFLKILVALGASIGPLAKALPITVLLQMLNVSLEKQLGGKVLEFLAGSLDERFTAAFNNDDKFQLGDAVKRSAMAGILKFTGKDSYENGDIERAAAKKAQETKEKDQASINSSNVSASSNDSLEIEVRPEFEEWDEKYRLSNLDLERLGGINPKTMDMTIASELVENGAFGPSAGTKFCVFCGTRLPGVATYCSSCGKQQPEV